MSGTGWRKRGLSQNPKPQIAAAPQTAHSGTNGDRLVLVMVGLPGTGKSYVAQRLRQYLRFFQGATVKVFNVGQYRQARVGAAASSFFDFSDPKKMSVHHGIYETCINDLAQWLRPDYNPEMEDQKQKETCTTTPILEEATDQPDRIKEPEDIKEPTNPEHDDAPPVPPADQSPIGRVAILDGTNVTVSRRKWLLATLEPYMESRRHIIFIESICNDITLFRENYVNMSQKNPDYKGAETQAMQKDYMERIEQYRRIYQPITKKEHGDLTWIRIEDFTSIAMHHIRGYLQGRIVQFLMNMHTKSRPIYLSRHGQSEYNKLKKVGGDSSLSPQGEAYAKALAEWLHTKVLNLNADGSWKTDEEGKQIRTAPHVRLFTSSLKRTRETARHIKHPVCDDGWVVMRPRVWRNLDEIYAGVFDGMTYDEIKAVALEEFQEREKHKLTYRYPRGESYLDVMERLDPIINELERQRDPVLIIGHQGILRIVYSYFMGLDRAKAPFISIPLNTVIKLTPATYDCDDERFTLINPQSTQGSDLEPPSH